jgi:hypothetical protein
MPKPGQDRANTLGIWSVRSILALEMAQDIATVRLLHSMSIGVLAANT